jgi:hypothetical protein
MHLADVKHTGIRTRTIAVRAALNRHRRADDRVSQTPVGGADRRTERDRHVLRLVWAITENPVNFR